MYVTLEEAKEYLRIDHDAEDETVSYLLASAERLCLDVLRNENPPKTETLRMGILFSVAYFYEHREEANYRELVLILRSLLFGERKELF
ncbi:MULTISPECIES: head-tail connector protein [Acidaminococcus]|jgi:hypothetical protein|uniref:head-tail connector protein n=1 Tax=Acidaminococcus TaxID=904 RepID=UPI000E70F979|nr:MULTISPECIES: head-tail connector protein [Acidaminococcus]RJU39209.1 phage gp6-like head-tail connector protein [Acidaminococcus sp. AM33-14BH]